MRRRSSLTFLLFCGALSAAAGEQGVSPDRSERALPAAMTLITTNARPPVGLEKAIALGIEAKRLNLDGLHNIQAFLRDGAPTSRYEDLSALTEHIRRRIQQIDPNDRDSAVRAQFATERWGIEKVPAMVFGRGESVIYGVTDFEQAIELWRKHK